MARSIMVACLGVLLLVYVSDARRTCDATGILACIVTYETAAATITDDAELCKALHEMQECSIPFIRECGIRARIARRYQPFDCNTCDHDFDLYFIVDVSTIATGEQFTDWIDFMKAVTGKLDLVKNKVGVIIFSGRIIRQPIPLGDYTDLSDLNTKIDALTSRRTTRDRSSIVDAIRFFNRNTAEYNCPSMGNNRMDRFVLTWNAQGNRTALSLAARRVNSHMNKRLFSFVQLNFKPGNREDRAYLRRIATPGLLYTLFDYYGYKKPIDAATDVVSALNVEANEAMMGIRHSPTNHG